MSFLGRLRQRLFGPRPSTTPGPVPPPTPVTPPHEAPTQEPPAPSPQLGGPREALPEPLWPPPPPRFVWSAPGRGGEVGYALREAVRERLGPATTARETWKAFLLDVDLEPEDGSWLQRDTLYANPREGDWTKFHVPDGGVVQRVSRIADDATTTRLARGSRLAYRGANVDPTEGLEGDVYEVLDGAHAGTFIYLGNGGRLGPAVWAAATTLVSGGSPGLDDPALADELLSLMRAVAIEHGAPGFAAEAAG
jgi:hypothetical protein